MSTAQCPICGRTDQHDHMPAGTPISWAEAETAHGLEASPDPHKVSTGMLLSLGSVVLSVAGGVAISWLVTAEKIDIQTFQQVTGYIGSLLAAGFGGALYAKRGS